MKTKEEEFVEQYLTKNDIDPDNVEFIHLLDMLGKYAEQVAKERAIEFGRWKQYSRYELMPIDYADFMVERN